MSEATVVTWFPPAALYSGRFNGVCDEINTSTLEEGVFGAGLWPEWVQVEWLREQIGWVVTPSFWCETLPHGRATGTFSWNERGRALEAKLTILARVVHATLGEVDADIAGTVRFPTLVLFEIGVEWNERAGVGPRVAREARGRRVVTTAVVRVPIGDAVAT